MNHSPFLLFLSTAALFAFPAAAAQLKDNSVMSATPPTRAPFSTDATKVNTNGSNLFSIYDSESRQDVVPMDKAHRTTEQVSTWVEDQITTVMNVDPAQWDEHLKKVTPYFDAFGLQEYKAYLNNTGVRAQLTDNRLKLSAISDGPAVLLNEASVSSSYHWLYDLPLMLTYYNDSTTTLKKGNVKPRNQKVIVRVQVGRVKTGYDDNNIAIERWSVVPVK